MNSQQEIQNLLFSLLFEMKSSLARSMKGNRFEMAPMHQKMLAYISNFPGTTQQEMVEKSGRDKAQITRLLKELEKRECIIRSKDQVDKRIFRIELTEKGHTIFNELRRHEDSIIEKLLEDFSASELEQLRASLKKMRGNLVAANSREDH
jgi:DNA-binding MarR family transcriptional regulator